VNLKWSEVDFANSCLRLGDTKPAGYGKEYSPHGLRHAYASAAHELNFGELTIKALLGHARVGVTSGYVARVDELLLAAADKIARYVWRSMTGEAGKVVPLSPPRGRQVNV